MVIFEEHDDIPKMEQVMWPRHCVQVLIKSFCHQLITLIQGQTGRVFQLRVGSGSGIEKIFRVGSGRVGYRVFVSNTKSIGYYGVLKS